MEKDPFKEYLRESEPDKAHKGYACSTAIGFQAVDGLKPSKYLIDIAIENIEGKITMKEAQSFIDSYYKERLVHLSDDKRVCICRFNFDQFFYKSQSKITLNLLWRKYLSATDFMVYLPGQI